MLILCVLLLCDILSNNRNLLCSLQRRSLEFPNFLRIFQYHGRDDNGQLRAMARGGMGRSAGARGEGEGERKP